MRGGDQAQFPLSHHSVIALDGPIAAILTTIPHPPTQFMACHAVKEA